MKKVVLGIFVSLVALFTYGEVNAESVTIEMPTVVMGAPQESSDNYDVDVYIRKFYQDEIDYDVNKTINEIISYKINDIKTIFLDVANELFDYVIRCVR